MATINHLLQRGVQRHLSGDFDGAKAEYRKLLEKESAHPDGLHLLGLAEYQSGNPAAALPLIRQAIQVNPKIPAFHSNLGSVLTALGQPIEALQAYSHSVELDPNYGDGWRNLGNLASRLNNHEVAAQAFSTLVRLTEGKDGQSMGYLGLSLAVLCDWPNVALTQDTILAQLPHLRSPLPPFSTLIYDFTPEQQRLIADQAAHAVHVDALKSTQGRTCPPRALPPSRPERLKIGYLGDDFQGHAVAYLFLGLLEAHDRTRFDISIYSYAPADDGDVRKRIVAAADRFVDIAPLNWEGSARKIHDDGIDILIDLKGHTGIPRSQILALRPAPIQVAWLGYPGTFGGVDCDYIIADSFVIPPEEEGHYSEKVARLPHCYQPNDPKRPRASTRPSRQQAGLPDVEFVFGALNNTFKITERMFGAWMDILTRCPDSVLWLLDHHPKTTDALQNAAQGRGVSPERLVFAPRANQADHMLRLSACDLGLDTFPYGGHTTTSDFLWAGVPVISLVGRTFASRVAGSLLTNAGLAPLAVPSLDEYIALATALFEDRKRLETLRTQLTSTGDACPLFDAALFARDFEQLLDRLYEQNRP